MKKLPLEITKILIASMLFPVSVLAANCIDSRDSYSNYDNDVSNSDIRNIQSEYYLLSYSWAPSFCKKSSKKSKHAGAKNYLQCKADNQFGYILHGLWPQGKISGKGGYPRACGGDQPKIARKQLSPYLCMTPSVWLLQHEYEYHGTCMPTRVLKSPQGYFGTALKLHQSLELPTRELANTSGSLSWWYLNNSQLVDGSVIYAQKSREWRFCYDTQFQSMACPGSKRNKLSTDKKIHRAIPVKTTHSVNTLPNERNQSCAVKGNISKKSSAKTYFLTSHPQYTSVKININSGERCFSSEQQAIKAGWRKAR